MNSYSVCDVMETHWPAAWSEQSPRWPTWPGPTGWTPGGAWAMCTSPPWTCTWLARYLTDKDKKKAKKAVLLKIKWQLVWLSQQSDQSWSCVYFVTLNECFLLLFFSKRACSRSTGRSINHLIKHLWFSSLAHGGSTSENLLHWLIVFICKDTTPHLSHDASLLHLALKVPHFLKYQQLDVPNMKGSRATLAHADLERDPSAELVTLKPAGAEHTSHVMHWAQHQHDKMRGERRTNGRHMRQKRAVTTHPLFGAKCCNLFINMPL